MVNVVDGFWNSSAQSANRSGNATQFLGSFQERPVILSNLGAFHVIIAHTISLYCGTTVLLLHFCSSSKKSPRGILSPNLRLFSPTVFNVLESWYVAATSWSILLLYLIVSDWIQPKMCVSALFSLWVLYRADKVLCGLPNI